MNPSMSTTPTPEGLSDEQIQEADYALLSALASIDTSDCNLRDQGAAYEALERYRAALAGQAKSAAPVEPAGVVAWLRANTNEFGAAERIEARFKPAAIPEAPAQTEVAPKKCVTIDDCTTPKLCLSVGTCKGYYVMPASVRESDLPGDGMARERFEAALGAGRDLHRSPEGVYLNQFTRHDFDVWEAAENASRRSEAPAQTEASRLADAIDPLTRKKPLDNLTLACAAKALRSLATPSHQDTNQQASDGLRRALEQIASLDTYGPEASRIAREALLPGYDK